MSPHEVVLVLVGAGVVLLGAAAALTVVRIARGPTSLDRVVAADVLVAALIAGLGLQAVVDDDATLLPVMLVLSVLGFAGSVSIARLVADRDKAVRWDALASRRSAAQQPVDPGGPGAAADAGKVLRDGVRDAEEER